MILEIKKAISFRIRNIHLCPVRKHIHNPRRYNSNYTRHIKSQNKKKIEQIRLTEKSHTIRKLRKTAPKTNIFIHQKLCNTFMYKITFVFSTLIYFLHKKIYVYTYINAWQIYNNP